MSTTHYNIVHNFTQTLQNSTQLNTTSQNLGKVYNTFDKTLHSFYKTLQNVAKLCQIWTQTYKAFTILLKNKWQDFSNLSKLWQRTKTCKILQNFCKKELCKALQSFATLYTALHKMHKYIKLFTK